MISTHSDRLDRWCGAKMTNDLSSLMVGSHFEPVPIVNSHGLKVCRDGDFIGKIKGGYFGSLQDFDFDEHMREARRRRALYRAFGKQVGAISALSSMLGAISAGKRQDFNVVKVGVTGVANIANSLWDVGTAPQSGGTSAAPSGASVDNTVAGTLPMQSPTGGDSIYFIGACIAPTVANNFLLLYDRYFQANHNMATDPQSITGVPSRYQSTAARNTFLTVLVTSALGAGTPTLTFTYMDQDGNTAEAAAAQTMVGSAIARRFPFAASVGNGWYIPLNSPDNGVRKLTNSDLSATNTGNVDLVLGKPVAWIPMPFANVPFKLDGALSPMDFVLLDSAAGLAFLELNKGATTATSYSGSVSLLTG